MINKFIFMVTALTLSSTTLVAKDDLSQEIAQLKSTGRAFASVAKKVSPAVVLIKVEKDVQQQAGRSSSEEEFLRRFFGQQRRQQPQQKRAPEQERQEIGQGSGFIISSDGLILTNNHVVGEADAIKVMLNDGREFPAEVIGTDPKSDVAVIKIKGKDLPILELGDSDKMDIGEWVLAVGNPFGLSFTVTSGIVSAKGRNAVGITDYENFIQTDAAINPGNSGGPLVDLDGKAIGINTAIFSRSGGYMGIGFAIPINMVKKIKDQLIADGSVTRGFLGIVMQELTPELAESFETKEGIIIAQVEPESPAEKAGLQSGDIIISYKNNAIKNFNAFRNSIALEKPGDKVQLEIIRNSKKKTLTVTIGSREALVALQSGRFGIDVENRSEALAQKYGNMSRSGVVITAVKEGSPAHKAGLEPGMIILQANRVAIDSTEDYTKGLRRHKDQLLLLIKTQYYSRYILLKK